MFDWDDEELTNMIWGDEGETGDHIVPFKVRREQLNKKEQSEASKKSNPTEQKITGNEVNHYDGKSGSGSGHNVDAGMPQPDFCMSSWPDSSLSNAREAGQDPSATELSKCLDEPAKYNSTREKTSELGKGPDIFHSTDEGKEQGCFDEYSWANIGSFDDLDRMFSNDVPIFGDGSLSGADELWSSSKDVSNSPSKLLQSILDPQDLRLDIRNEFEHQENQNFHNLPSSQSVPSRRLFPKVEKCFEHKGQPSIEDQFLSLCIASMNYIFSMHSNLYSFTEVIRLIPCSFQPYQQNKMMKFSKMSGTSEARAFQDLYGQRIPSSDSPRKFVNQLAPSRSSLMAGNLQTEPQGSGASQYPHMPNQYMATSGIGNLTNPYSTVHVLSAVQCPDFKNQLIHPSYNPATALSVNMATDASARPSTMTPQEKLEKLRRRQQMQAMLAIQRQQQQFRHQVPVIDQYITQKTNLQGLPAMPSFEPNSSLEVDDSGKISAAVDNSAEFSVLYRLQDVVAKLDMGTRTCIRDSLFRLAGSAGQRNHTGDSAQSKKGSQCDHKVILKEESKYRYAGIPDTETVTNPADRTVAHLLFHRPFDILAAKHMEEPESPSSSRMGTEEKRRFPKCSRRESHLKKQKANEEEAAAGSLALGDAHNSEPKETKESCEIY
ncbi:unnamed protein product [Cochlearia groenlandica]